MARTPNPFRPGFNQPPASLAGRQHIIAAIVEALDVAALDNRTPRPIVLTGGRGVGKTVLLGEAAVIAAEQHSWLTVPIEIRPDSPFTPQLIERLKAATAIYTQAPPGKAIQISAAKVRASVLGVGGEVELRRAPTGPPPTPTIDAALTGACLAAMEHTGGLLITVDELQLADRAELADFAATLQQHVPDGWPLLVIFAGLPSIRDTQRNVTYLERAEWHVLGLLDPEATETALTEPAADAGRPLTPDAVTLLAEAAGGYPYAIQVIGHHAWRASTGSPTIEVQHAEVGLAAADADLGAGLYESRWQDASAKEREFLQALAPLTLNQANVTTSDVAKALNKKTSTITYLQARLIKKGTIFSGDGGVRFAVPGMANWITKRE